jgi:hypothetical protein
VPRLTLIFFGASKDVPEAAKMVIAGAACPNFSRSKPMAKHDPAFKLSYDL